MNDTIVGPWVLYRAGREGARIESLNGERRRRLPPGAQVMFREDTRVLEGNLERMEQQPPMAYELKHR